jgi:hypothetical protein
VCVRCSLLIWFLESLQLQQIMKCKYNCEPSRCLFLLRDLPVIPGSTIDQQSWKSRHHEASNTSNEHVPTVSPLHRLGPLTQYLLSPHLSLANSYHAEFSLPMPESQCVTIDRTQAKLCSVAESGTIAHLYISQDQIDLQRIGEVRSRKAW